jgi:Fic family protein
LERDGELDTLHERASVSLGRLDGLSRLLPDPEFFLYGYVRKEALLSSQIEGTQSSFSDLLLYEAKEVPGMPLADVEEVSRYVAALEYGLRRLREGFPLSLRLIRGIHGELLRSGRGAGKQPGEFRTAQNWVGGAKPSLAAFVPPPPDRLMDCLDAFERFLHQDDQPMPSLIRAALAHAQFETIHPFLEGNGRIGRLLITLLLCTEDMISQPTLYLSLHFKTYRADSYDWLQRVRRTGDWEGWVKFFLKGVIATSDQAVETAHRIQDLFKEDQQKVETLGRASGSALRLFQELQRRPLQTIGLASRSTGLSAPTVTEALLHLVRLGIVEEVTGRKRRRIYVYRRYLKELEQGTEPPGREGAGSVPTQRTTAPSRDPA